MNTEIHIKNEWGLRTNWLETHPKVTLVSKSNRYVETKVDDQSRTANMALHKEMTTAVPDSYLSIKAVRNMSHFKIIQVNKPCTQLRTNQIFLAKTDIHGFEKVCRWTSQMIPWR